VFIRSSGTLAALEPEGENGFDFTPAELPAARSMDGYFHLGDLNLRLRQTGASDWKGYSTVLERRPVKELPSGPGN